jgi:hypothetical protein
MMSPSEQPPFDAQDGTVRSDGAQCLLELDHAMSFDDLYSPADSSSMKMVFVFASAQSFEDAILVQQHPIQAPENWQAGLSARGVRAIYNR